MAKKQFKIGENAVGGIIAVETFPKNETVSIKALDWNSKREVKGQTFSNEDTSKMDWFLFDLTTSYYTSKVMDWIKANIK
jgi:hypothetical protein